MIAASVVSGVMERLQNLLLAEGSSAGIFVGDLGNGVEKLLPNLEEIKQLLLDSDVDGIIQKKIIELACEIEDAIDTLLVAVKSGGVMSSVVKRFSNMSFRHDLKRRIDDLSSFIGDSLSKRDARSKSSGDQTRSIRTSTIDHKTTRVGMNPESQKLHSVLIDDTRVSVIAICGMGGSGKTTLAQLVYDESLTVHHFDCRAWVNVGMDFQARDILENMLFDLSSTGRSKKDIAQMNTMDLMEHLYRSLKGRRYLVVLDDLWSVEAWETIGVAFPKDNNGSKVVITTRSTTVAQQANAYIHEMKMLSEEDSWELLKMQLGLQDDHQLGIEAEEIGKKIIKQCHGLPLAIVVIGGLLRETKLEDWKDVQRDIFQQAQNPGVEHILDLSYNQLPFNLKECFLYLGHFPPDQEIQVDKLYLLWMAEGLISTKNQGNKSRLMDVAEDYLKDLADRGLVILQNEELEATRNLKSCHLHDIIRHLCIRKGKRENFSVAVFGPTNESISSTRRVAIYLNKLKQEDGNGVALNIPKHVRSILFFDEDEYSPKPVWPREYADLKEFPLTRVLDFDGVDFGAKMLPKSINKLLHLRYLSFRGCYLEKFPSSFSKLMFLETLDLRVRRWCRMIIPNVVRKLINLKHLYFPEEFLSDTQDKLKLDSLTRLEILENFHASICDANDLLHLKNIYIFTGIVDGNTLDLEKIADFIKSDVYLRHSSLVVRNFDSYSNQRKSIVQDLLSCGAIDDLDIKGYLGKLPSHDGIGSNFSKIVFNGCEFSEDPMPILGKLPNLRSLVLSHDAFVGNKMVCSQSDFKELRNLELLILNSLEKWEVEKGAMPKLATLTIVHCKKLQMLPDDLIKTTSLRELHSGSMSEKLNKSVRGMSKKKSFGTDELQVTFYDN